jgi:hypothetical protein
MKQPTIVALRALLAADPPRDNNERSALAVVLGMNEKNGAVEAEIPRVMPFDEVARVLACTQRNVHQLCRAGQLRKIVLPGRRLSRGVLAEDVKMLITTCVRDNSRILESSSG